MSYEFITREELRTEIGAIRSTIRELHSDMKGANKGLSEDLNSFKEDLQLLFKMITALQREVDDLRNNNLSS